MKKFGIENPSFPPLHDSVIRQKREECCRDHGSYGSGKARKPLTSARTLRVRSNCGFTKNLPDFRSPNITVSITIFKERIYNVFPTAKLVKNPVLLPICPKVLYINLIFGGIILPPGWLYAALRRHRRFRIGRVTVFFRISRRMGRENAASFFGEGFAGPSHGLQPVYAGLSLLSGCVSRVICYWLASSATR